MYQNNIVLLLTKYTCHFWLLVFDKQREHKQDEKSFWNKMINGYKNKGSLRNKNKIMQGFQLKYFMVQCYWKHNRINTSMVGKLKYIVFVFLCFKQGVVNLCTAKQQKIITEVMFLLEKLFVENKFVDIFLITNF